MSERRAKKILVVAVVWLVIAGLLAVGYRLLIKPKYEQRVVDETGSESLYTQDVSLALDSFSGYSILRSPAMTELLQKEGIRLDLHDDGADYTARMKALSRGDVDMAVFTIDSYLLAGARQQSFPGSIVMVIDESTGADAVVSYDTKVRSFDDLNHRDARIVATPNSPSEFLARTIIAHFNLPQLSDNWLIEADGAEQVYQRMRSGSKSDRRAYVMWEPFVSKAAQLGGAKVLMDSSKLSGYVVDVLVCEREFLRENRGLVQTIVEAYLRSTYVYASQPDKLIEMLRDDAKQFGGERLKQAQAQRLAESIRWKNTIENYAHFGLLPQEERAGLKHLEIMIDNIGDVLVKTGALDKHPVEDSANTLFFNKVLLDIKRSGFHPGRDLNLITGLSESTDTEDLRGAVTLPTLSDDQWQRLIEVGELRTQAMSFARGSARLHLQSQRDLVELATKLSSFPHYYLEVIGTARNEGDLEANMLLARQRADAVVKYLTDLGVATQRLRAVARKPFRRGAEAQSVSFRVGQRPY